MRVLVLGSDGYIGRYITSGLLEAGHQVTGAVRQAAPFRHRFPGAEAVAIDLNRMLTPEAWAPVVAGIDAVVQAAGAIMTRGGDDVTKLGETGSIRTIR